MLGHDHDEMHFSGSQDVWAFIGGDMVGLGDDIPLGYVGCDNRIVGDAVLAGFEVCNPALSIVVNHVHACGPEQRDRPNTLGYYGYPELTTISSGFFVLCHEWSEMRKSTDAEVICTMKCQP
jgi:hypothetical protein